MSNRPLLSIRSYNRSEAFGTRHFSIPQMMAFRPKAFEMAGWPIRVSSETELLRYVDHNFEHEVAGMYRPGAEFAPAAYRNSFTHDEHDLVSRIRDRVGEVTQMWCGRSIRPASNILVQVGPYRVVHQIAAAFRSPQLSVFEVGPGAGYLGAMLATTGYRYASYDVTQALYLWQSRLLQAVVGNELMELAGRDGVPGQVGNNDIELTIGENPRVLHLPWWLYTNFLEGTRLRADIVYSNSNLGEMSRLATRHVLHISRHMLADSPLGIFCFISKGNPSVLSHEAVDEDFRLFSYHKVLDKPFTAYALNPDVGPALRQAFASGIPDYDPSRRGGTLSASDLTPIRRAESPLDVALTQWYYGWEPPYVD